LSHGLELRESRDNSDGIRRQRIRGEVVMDGKRLLTNDVFDSDSDPEGSPPSSSNRPRSRESPPKVQF